MSTPPARSRLRTRAGVRAALLAIAATSGALIVFGHATGLGPLEPFRALGRRLVGIPEIAGGSAPVLALVAGVGGHALAAAVWAWLFAAFGARLPALLVPVAAVAWSLVPYWLARHDWLPVVLRVGYGVRAFPPQLLFVHLLLALALVVGIRLAR